MGALVLTLLVGAAQRLFDGFAALVWRPDAPIDLGLRFDEVGRWFAGQPVYSESAAVYPPAAHPLLWLLIGWPGLAGARLTWALTSLAGIVWLVRLSVTESGARTALGLSAAALLPAAVYPTRAVLVNGQITLHVLPVTVAAVLLLHRRAPSWPRDLGAAGLLLLGMAKPTVAAPFLWFLVLARRPWRPALLLGVGYVGLTLLAASFQPAGPVELLGQFAVGASREAARAAATAHANLHSWLDAAGLGWASAPASLLALGGLGLWLRRGRSADVWLGLGLAAIVARMWTYHYRYDDLLLVLPLIALVRQVTRTRGPSPDVAAGMVLALLGASLLLPARLIVPPSRFIETVETGQTVVWLATALLLALRAAGASRAHATRARRPAGRA
jgi:hypothetical protein